MFKHVLIPTDGSSLSDRAALGAVRLAKSLSAHVTAINVSVPFRVFAMNPRNVSITEASYREECKKRAAGYLGSIRKAAESEGVTFDRMHVFAEQPYAAIIEAADDQDCDVICMASHGHKGLAALVLRSETIQVLTHSRIPVVVWR